LGNTNRIWETQQELSSCWCRKNETKQASQKKATTPTTLLQGINPFVNREIQIDPDNPLE